MLNGEDILESLSSLKVIVFMEVEPLTDRFQQICLTSAQARTVRDSIFLALNPTSNLEERSDFVVLTNDQVEVLIPNVQDTYDEALKNV